jgi:hypothetical protein
MRPDVIGKCAVMVVVDCRTIELYLYFFFFKKQGVPLASASIDAHSHKEPAVWHPKTMSRD